MGGGGGGGGGWNSSSQQRPQEVWPCLALPGLACPALSHDHRGWDGWGWANSAVPNPLFLPPSSSPSVNGYFLSLGPSAAD